MKNLIILISLSLLISGCAMRERVSGHVSAGANDDSQSVGGEVHYQLYEW